MKGPAFTAREKKTLARILAALALFAAALPAAAVRGGVIYTLWGP